MNSREACHSECLIRRGEVLQLGCSTQLIFKSCLLYSSLRVSLHAYVGMRSTGVD